MSTPDDFTVVWLCALEIEFTTATRLLDETYRGTLIPSIATSRFVLGRYAQHRVVIVCLPLEAYGTASPALVVDDILQTFKHIKFVLSVGIGGGAPSSRHDIRLGDIVVSGPGNRHGGVIRYDFGKLGPDGAPYQRMSMLNEPPMTLLYALARLEIPNLLDKPLFGDIVSELSVNDRRLEDPGVQYDVLYQSTYTHQSEHGDCSSCDNAAIIARPSRISRTPRIHYGRICCGNLVLKDGETRDRLNKEHDVLCFEMEAAGLPEQVPVLLIRGISDYADSHKNDHWQGYAAATAAAYAKELLHSLPTDASDISNNADADNVSTSSITLVNDLENELINKAAAKVADVLSSDKRLKALCTACVLRMTGSAFQRSIIKILSRYGNNIKKPADTPLGQSLAFVLRNRKGLISFIMRERTYPSRGEPAEKVSQLQSMSEKETRRLKQLIESKFPSPQYKGARKALQDDTGAEQNVDDADLERDLANSTPSLTQLDLQNIEGILCTGEAYWEAYNELKLVALPIPAQQLTDVLQMHISDDGSSYAVDCMIQWKVVEFIESEEIMETQVDSIMTLTGTPNQASVCSLGDYMQTQWSSGKAVLDAMKELLAPFFKESSSETGFDWVTKALGLDHEFHIRMLPIEEGAEQALLQVKGSFGQIHEILDAFSWLTATLRPSKGRELTVSEIRFETANDSAQLFKLSLLDQAANWKPDPKEPGQCWTSLFTESNLAYGFPLSGDKRPSEMLGLEIPLQLMAAFSGVEYPVLFEGQIILAGSSTLLTPVVSAGACIQWHYSKGEDRFKDSRQHLKELNSSLITMSWKELISTRAFLGYGSNVEVLLGTRYLLGTGITDSRVPYTGNVPALENEGTFGIELGFKGFFKASLGGKWVRRGEMAQIPAEHRSLIDYIQPARHTPALLYDYEAGRAFLVSELSIMLNLVSSYLRNCSSMAEDQIPCAEPRADGGEAAFEIIEQHKDIIVPLKIGESRKYCDIIHDFIHIWEQRKSQTSAAQAEINSRFSTSIRGWDYIDLQNKQYEISEREISTAAISRRSAPIWWKVFKKQPCMVVFGGNIGCPIRKVAHEADQPYCNAWEDLPTGEHLLLVQLSSLTQLSKKFFPRAKSINAHHMITNKLAWARPKGSTLFEVCTHGTGNRDTCSPVQTMRKVGGWHHWDKSHDRTPGVIANHPHGAVLFANDPKDFSARPCRFVLPIPPDPPQPNPASVQPLPEPSKEYSVSIICCIFAGCFSFVYILSTI